jgi:Cu+-exporting ATPase
MAEKDRRTFKMIKDPVCGMVVDPTRAVATSVHNEKTYYFCTSDCKTVFELRPEKFVGQTETDHDSSQESVQEENYEYDPGQSGGN